jgi:hypothetical protein
MGSPARTNCSHTWRQNTKCLRLKPLTGSVKSLFEFAALGNIAHKGVGQELRRQWQAIVVVGIALEGSTLLYAESRHLQFVQGALRLSRDVRGGRGKQGASRLSRCFATIKVSFPLPAHDPHCILASALFCHCYLPSPMTGEPPSFVNSARVTSSVSHGLRS